MILTEDMLSNTYEAQIIKLIDGDTIDLSINLGFDTYIVRRIRLIDIDCPEINNTKRTSNTNKAGMVALGWLSEFLQQGGPIYRLKAEHKGIYGRWLGEIWREVGEESLNDFLKSKGYSNSGWSWTVQKALIEEWYDDPNWYRNGKNSFLGQDTETGNRGL